MNTKFQKGVAVGLFLLSLLVILLLYPSKKQFRYSYQVGKPWQYETLYAPFQFPVKKSNTQILAEKENLLKQTTAYYDFDKIIGAKQIAKAQKDSVFSKKELEVLANIYAVPILNSDSLKHEGKRIFIVKNHIATEQEIAELQTISTIKKYISEQNIKQSQKKLLLSYLKPNLTYNKEQTEAMSDSKNISAYQGKVQANELIISRGEVVTQRNYQILESLRDEYSKRIGTSNNNIGFVILGQFFFVALCLLFLYIFLRNYREDVLSKPLYLSFILLGIIVSVLFSRILLSFGRLDILLVPYTLFAIIIRTFIDSRTALFSYLAAILICSFIVPQSYEFIILQVVTGVIAVLYLKYLDRRSQLLLTALIVFVSYSVLSLALFFTSEEKIETLNPMIFVRFLLNAVFLTVAYPLLYLLEKVFGFLSDVTLIELSNTNNKLLRKLSHEAPGTFQHSLQVANLSEEAVRKIGGNPLLVRAGALYHDIGKMENPIYFTENQYGETSPHKELSYEESAKIIINHVIDGVKIAKKYNLPQYLIDFISTHHGKGKAEYFYRSQINENPEEEVDQADFSYPGPDPFSVEQAVLMMADSCEAATRSLKKKTEGNIAKMVTNIIDSQKAKGRFNNSPITFKDIEITKEIFIQKLTNIYHSRIAYPKKKEEQISDLNK